MPVHYRYDEASRRLVTRCYGTVTLADVAGHFHELTSLSRLQPNSDVLLDMTFLQIELPEMERIEAATRVLEELSDFLQFGRCAVVAADGIPAEIARRFQAVGWPLFRGMRIFSAVGDAAAWLEREHN